jgi:multiple sugar transport system substrate-binding protein
MRRYFFGVGSIIVLVFFLGSLLAGAEELKLGRFDGVTIKACLIGGGDYEKIYEKFFPKFEELTGAKVKIVYKGNGFEIDKKMKLDFAAKAIDYDVCWNHTSFFSQYFDFVEPLEKYFTEEELKDFSPRIMQFAWKDGHLWFIPRHADISALYYRTDIFNDPEVRKKFREKYGYELRPPETWDEFKEIAIFLSNPPELYGTQFAGKEEALTGRFWDILMAYGGKIIDENYKPAFNGPEGVKAATILRDLYQAGAMPPGMVNFLWDDVAANFANGTIAMYTEWYGWYSYFQDPTKSKVAGKFDLARQPKGDAGIHSGWAGAHAFSVTKFSKNKEAAAALVKYITSYEPQLFEAHIGYIPVRNSVFETLKKEAESSTDPLAKKRVELMQLQINEDFTPPPIIPEWIAISDILYPILQAIILGDKPVKEGLDEAAQKVEELLAEAGYYD